MDYFDILSKEKNQMELILQFIQWKILIYLIFQMLKNLFI